MSAAGSDAIETVPLTVPPALEAIGVSKSFGTVRALEDVSLTLERGTIHALLGENGAGKSTLVKCIMGFYQADAGRISVGGVEARIASPRDAAGLGIGMVYQHFTLVDAMTVAENLVLSRRQAPLRVQLGGGAKGGRGVHGHDAVPARSVEADQHAGGGREAEARDPEAALSRQLDRDPRRADVGADAGRGRRGAGAAARHGQGRAPDGADDLAQVPRGDAVRRRGDRAAARAVRRAAAASPT